MEAKKNTRRIWAHILFWIILSSVPLYYNSVLFGLPTSIVRTIIPLSFLIILAYGNILVLIPYLFRRKDFVWYRPLAYFIILPLAIFALQNLFIFVGYLTNIEVSLIFEARQNGALVKITQTKDAFPTTMIGLLILFILFVSSLYGLAIEFMRRDRQQIELQATNLKNELKLLRRQINPHFLFNALNNLYAIVQLKPEKAGDFVLKLSDMLRYVTYDCQSGKVFIEKEIAYLNNYVYFQKWRDQNFKNIELTIDNNVSNFKIEPMLLIPFVENAFKHSYDNKEPSNRWIHMHLSAKGNLLTFDISNSLSGSKTQEDVPDEYMGIGIENVRKRLELLYAGKSELSIKKSANSFQIILSIELS